MSLLGGESGQRAGTGIGAMPMTPVVDGAEMDMVGMERALIPMLMCHAARVGDLNGLSTVFEEFLPMINMGDYDGRVGVFVCLIGEIASEEVSDDRCVVDAATRCSIGEPGCDHRVLITTWRDCAFTR